LIVAYYGAEGDQRAGIPMFPLHAAAMFSAGNPAQWNSSCIQAFGERSLEKTHVLGIHTR
jgi:hypothetical protein